MNSYTKVQSELLRSLQEQNEKGENRKIISEIKSQLRDKLFYNISAVEKPKKKKDGKQRVHANCPTCKCKAKKKTEVKSAVTVPARALSADNLNKSLGRKPRGRMPGCTPGTLTSSFEVNHSNGANSVTKSVPANIDAAAHERTDVNKMNAVSFQS